MVEEERTKAAGRAVSPKDSIDMTDVERAGSRNRLALADQALADFAAREGISSKATRRPRRPRARWVRSPNL